MGYFFIVSCQERKERVIDPMTSFLMFFPKVLDSIFKPKSPSLIKTTNKRNGSFPILASSSWIWLHSKHHSTTNDPWIGLKCKY
jgi:hypothetical protein